MDKLERLTANITEIVTLEELKTVVKDLFNLEKNQ